MPRVLGGFPPSPPLAPLHSSNRNPTPYTLHPTPYTLHPTPYTRPSPTRPYALLVLSAALSLALSAPCTPAPSSPQCATLLTNPNAQPPHVQCCSQNRVRYSPGVKDFVWSSVYSSYALYHLPQIGSDDAW
jgi:hypothetical protein